MAKKEKNNNNSAKQNVEKTELVAETTQDAPLSDETAENSTTATPQPNVEKLPKRRRIDYVITVGVVAVLTLLCGLLFEGYTSGDAKTLVGAWSNCFSAPGIVCLGVGLLIWCSNEGAFDMLGYGVRSLFRLFRKDVKDRKYGDFYGYQQARRSRKKPYLFLVVVGGGYLLVGIILIIIYSVL